MSNKMASIQKIDEIAPIQGADSIEHARIGGWWVVVKKGTLHVGSPVVFFSIDSLLPETAPWAKFLADKGKEHLRIKSIRLRGALSQGLALPAEEVLMGAYLDMGEAVYKDIPDPQEAHEMSEITGVEIDDYGIEVTTALGFQDSMPFGHDVTNLLDVQHYEKPVPPSSTSGSPSGGWPGYIPKTDETMLQNIPGILKALEGQEVYVTVKCDGTSSTFARNDDKRDVCGRNWSYHEFCMDDAGQPTDKRSLYWEVYRKYGIDRVLDENDGIAIQGEIVGPGVQRNRLGLKELELRVFDVWSIKDARYLSYVDLSNFCSRYNLPMVPVIDSCIMMGDKLTMAYWLEKARGVYEGTKNRREGIVIRAVKSHYVREVKNRASFKALNNDYLVKDED